jgi:hypothetical protein
MQERHEIIEKVKSMVEKEFLSIVNDKQKYKTLLGKIFYFRKTYCSGSRETFRETSSFTMS